MTKITIYKDHETNYKGFKVEGHSGYAGSGNDVICAGISVLVINTVNSLEELTNNTFELNTDEASGLIHCIFTNNLDQNGVLLMNSLVLGLEGIVDSYDSKYIQLTFKEV